MVLDITVNVHHTMKHCIIWILTPRWMFIQISVYSHPRVQQTLTANRRGSELQINNANAGGAAAETRNEPSLSWKRIHTESRRALLLELHLTLLKCVREHSKETSPWCLQNHQLECFRNVCRTKNRFIYLDHVFVVSSLTQTHECVQVIVRGNRKWMWMIHAWINGGSSLKRWVLRSRYVMLFCDETSKHTDSQSVWGMDVHERAPNIISCWASLCCFISTSTNTRDPYSKHFTWKWKRIRHSELISEDASG